MDESLLASVLDPSNALALTQGGGAVAALALLTVSGWLGYLGAARTFPSASASVRLAAAMVISWWLLTTLFYALALLGLFRLIVALPLLALLTWVVHQQAGTGDAARITATSDRTSLQVWYRDLGWPIRLVVMVFTMTLGFRLLRGLVAPPLAWDSLTYHLIHPARWVQSGGFVRELAPGNWSFYEYFPIGGEIVWGWAMLPMHGDALLAPAGVLVLLSVVVAVYACARLLGAARPRSTLVALTVASVPAVFGFTTTGYVDNAVLALAGLGLVFVLREDSSPQRANAVIAAAAFGLCAAVKMSAVLILPAALAVLLVQILRGAASTRGALRAVAGLIPGFAICLPHFVRSWYSTGSPVYPFSLDLLGLLTFEGNSQAAEFLFAPSSGPEASVSTLLYLMTAFDAPWNLNIGPTGWVVGSLGIIGFIILFRRRTASVGAAFLLALVAIMVAIAASDDASPTRNYFWHLSGRYFTVGFLALAIPAALVPARRLDSLWCALPLISLAIQTPWTASDMERSGMATLLVGLLCVAGASMLLLALQHGRVRKSRRRFSVALVATFFTGALLGFLRADSRSGIYAEASQGLAFDAQEIHHGFGSSWPIWQYLDALPSERLAIATGWGGPLHNEYRYPLLGNRLQHSLHSIPTSRSGRIIDARRTLQIRKAAHFPSWVMRLVQQEIDLLITLEPDTTLEGFWARRHPDLFQRVAESTNGQSVAYRFDRAAAKRSLSGAHARRRSGSAMFTASDRGSQAFRKPRSDRHRSVPIVYIQPSDCRFSESGSLRWRSTRSRSWKVSSNAPDDACRANTASTQASSPGHG